MIEEVCVKSNKKNELINITSQIQKIVFEKRINSGFCILYVPHTTAGLIINENADPNVKIDLLNSLEKLVPKINFKHLEGNSDAHLKTLLCGKEKILLIKDSKLVLGIWDGIFLGEFDGPRNRVVFVKLFKD